MVRLLWCTHICGIDRLIILLIHISISTDARPAIDNLLRRVRILSLHRIMAELFINAHNPSKPIGLFNSNNESPRSCANPSIFHDILPPSYYSFDHHSDDADGNGLRNVSYEDEMDEESPAEVAMLLTSVADIASKEIKADPPVMNALADAFPRFPDNISPAVLSNEVDECHQGEYEDMEVEVDQHQHPKSEELSPHAPLMHFDHKKARSVSMDSPELRANKAPWVPSPPLPQYQDEASTPALLQWRDLRGKSTSPPHLQHGIFSTPPPSPLLKHRHHHQQHHGQTMTPNPIGRPHLYLSPKSRHQNRPRSISLAEAAKQIPDLDLTAPTANDMSSAAIQKSSTATTSGAKKNDVPVKEVILRKKFSWKNYPQLEEFLIGEYLGCCFVW